jgi:uncharacterized membrane protein YdjX (TVP38/TMEM64 family)
LTVLNQYLKQRSRDVRTMSWWREHALMIAPWILIIAAVLVSIAIYYSSDTFRAGIDQAFAVVMTGDQIQIRDYILSYGAWAPIVSILIMIGQVIIVGIPATIVLFANGVAFGITGGAAVNIIGRMLGAIVAFGIARMLGKGAVEKLVGKIADAEKFEAWMERWGGWAVFATRAIPGMPSDLLSYVAGFTKVSWKTYLVATLFGFLPQSIVYAWFGSEATSWFWAVMLIGTVVSAVVAVTAFLIQWIRRSIRRQQRHGDARTATRA